MTGKEPLINRPPDPSDKKAYLAWRKKRDRVMLYARKQLDANNPGHPSTGDQPQQAIGGVADGAKDMDDPMATGERAMQITKHLRKTISKGRSRGKAKAKGLFK